MRKIILAAGCFWSVQYKFSNLAGVTKVTAVYTNGETKNANYEAVCSGESGHAEGVLIEYDEDKISTKILLKFFFEIHDATELNRQGPDIGEQYRSGIFYFEQYQKDIAITIINELEIGNKKYKNKKIVTIIEPANQFCEAEEYHQNYYKKKGF